MSINLLVKTKIFLIFFILFTGELTAQLSKINGRVTDEETGEPIPFANVYIKGTSLGVIANDSGFYYIATRLKKDSITATFLGYQSSSKPYIHKTYQVIDFELKKSTTTFEEVIVRPYENPAHKMLRSIWKNKSQSQLKSHDVQCKIYNKLQMKLSNIDETFKNRKILKPFQFVFEFVDTNAVNGKTYLPVLISETFTEYYRKYNPAFEREVVTATQISGIDNESVREFVGGINQSFDPLENYMVFYNESGFISPLSESGLLFYRYTLEDSVLMDGEMEYKISFKPRRKQERTFIGHFIVVGNEYQLKKLQMHVNPEANLNYITDFIAEYDFETVNDSLVFLKKEHLLVDFNLADFKNLKGLQGEKTTIYSDFRLNQTIPDHILSLEEKVIFDDDTKNSISNENRPEKLSEKEQQVYNMVDSIKNVPAFRTTYDLLKTLFDAHYDFGKFKIGPYFSVYSYNRVEGHRFRVGGTTTSKFSDRIKFTAYTAYGTDDRQFKYFADAIVVLNKSPRVSFTGTIRHDISQLNVQPGALINDNIISSFLRRNPFDKLQMINNEIAQLEADIFPGVTVQAKINHVKLYPEIFIPFINPVTRSNYPYVESSELSANIHFESGQRFFSSKFRRFRLRNYNPAFDINITAAPGDILGNKFNYWKFKLKISHYLPTNPFGFNRYSIEACKTTGSAPWPLLEVMSGNESYGLYRYTYNMMNYYEFVADSYVALSTEQHLQGMIFNYIPLFRKLKFREVLSCKAVAGKISDKNIRLMQLPDYMYSLNKPYIEVGVGIENILKFIRIDGLWRLTHKDNPNVQIFGLRARFQFML